MRRSCESHGQGTRESLRNPSRSREIRRFLSPALDVTVARCEIVMLGK
jgi:hypothetical protein